VDIRVANIRVEKVLEYRVSGGEGGWQNQPSVESPNLALLQKTANPTNPLAVFIQPKAEDQRWQNPLKIYMIKGDRNIR